MFDPLVSEWFAERFGAPTAPQRRGWPAIEAGADTLIAAPTGSGKTLAAFLHCIDDVLRRARDGRLEERTYVVYISPLKALSHDIHVNLQTPLSELAARLGVAEGKVRVGVRTGDTPARERQLQARTPPHILVTTPESLYILLTTRRGRSGLARVSTVIVDEIHAIADDRRGAHLALSLERLDALRTDRSGSRAQRIGLSATQKPIELMGQFLTGGQPCTVVDEGHARTLDVEIMSHHGELAAVASHEQWAEIEDQIAELARNHCTTIVFTNTRRLSERLAHALTRRLGEGLVAAHHGALSRGMRLDAERRLRDGSLKVIVATASLELGIDVGAVDLVCQIGTPRAIATLLQRVGRAGHATGATPKGRLFALTRDDLVECAALARALRAKRLDAIEVPAEPLDVLAQQLVAACAGVSAPSETAQGKQTVIPGVISAGDGDWNVDELYALTRRAYPFRDLSRATFDAVLDMLSEGVATRRGRSSAHLHRDRVGNRVRARRGARLAAIMSGGAIPDRADYEVVADPEGMKVGTLDEDFAIEASAGSVFLLGNMSWRIKRVEAGRVRVEDAHGQAPTVPFWLGEGPSRTTELSEEVSTLRAEVETRLCDHPGDRTVAEAWVREATGLDEHLTKQLVDYLLAARSALGALPTTTHVVAERFFDEGGGMQLVIHAPFGARINRAWGMALRKSFCRSFDFELQAAATDDGIVLSLGAQHSFPLDIVPEYVPVRGLTEILQQAALQAPMFETRWRWNAGRSLSILRRTGRGKVPPQLLRMRAADLLAAVFPQVVACQDNHGGGLLEPPDHPLVNQTLRDCLEEVMDAKGLVGVLEGLKAGAIRFTARELPEPSVMAHALLNANPYAYLDDAPLEERRTRAVSVRRGLPANLAAEVGALDADAIVTVRRDAAPPVRDAEELHDLLCLTGAWSTPEDAWHGWFAQLAAARRATRLMTPLGLVWVAAERLPLARAAYGENCPLDPPIDAAPGAKIASRDEALVEIARGRLEQCGPITEAELGGALRLPAADVASACARLEGTGLILRGRFTPGRSEMEWVDRRLLARIHRLTLGRLRREIEPVTPAELLRFLAIWQHTAPGTQLFGASGLEVIIAQLAGYEAPTAAWEDEILPARVAGYDPSLLDELCLSGDLVWGRRAASTAGITTRATPISLWPRAMSPWMMGPSRPVEDPDSPAAAVERVLRARGALFTRELAEATGLMKAQLEQGLWSLVASGRITADGFAALRALAGENRAARVKRAGRWSLLECPACAPEVAVEKQARQLLARYGVVLRELCLREELPPWRDLLMCWRSLEARGEIRGGRFVAGFVGEQFALPAAVDALRAARRQTDLVVTPTARDPLAIRVLLPPSSLALAMASPPAFTTLPNPPPA